MTECRSCHATVTWNVDDQPPKFCYDCGVPIHVLELSENAAERMPKFCPACGKAIPQVSDDSAVKFCMYCGYRLYLIKSKINGKFLCQPNTI